MKLIHKSRSSKYYSSLNRVQLLRGGSKYFELLLNLINNARESIHLQTYILADDETGQSVVDALKEAVKRNVEVYLLTDGYASQGMSASFLNDLKKGGIHFRFFEPVFRSRHFYFGRRLHHKVIVIDTRYALVGGVNIANKYNDLPGQAAWLDFAIYIEGEIARELCVLCWKSWNGYPFQLGLTPCDKKTFSFSIPTENRCEVRMRRNDWVRRKNEISGTYVEMLRTAKKEITILCSYFLPGKFIRKQITNAVKRGVRIKVVTAGISDVVLAKNAERWFYDWLLRNGVELYEYQKNVLHGKIAVCDDLLMTVGSYNINNISAYASIELNIDVRNANFAGATRQMLDEIIANDCMAITHEHQVKTNNIIKQFVRWLSYQFIRIVFHLFTFYFRREH